MAKKATTTSIEDILEKLERAKAMAFVLADAAGGELGVEDGNVHHVSLMIAREVEQALESIKATEQRAAA